MTWPLIWKFSYWTCQKGVRKVFPLALLQDRLHLLLKVSITHTLRSFGLIISGFKFSRFFFTRIIIFIVKKGILIFKWADAVWWNPACSCNRVSLFEKRMCLSSPQWTAFSSLTQAVSITTMKINYLSYNPLYIILPQTIFYHINNAPLAFDYTKFMSTTMMV